MAEYTWRQWENEQNDENLLHAADCERWQAGIELAGGSWDGSWTDLDTSGKGLITIDQFNALESQIQSKVSSYTPKGYDPDSTVRIVPGPDGWNKVENGILKAVCTPDGVNRNLLRNTKAFDNKSGESFPASNAEGFTYDGIGEDGFGVWGWHNMSSGNIYIVSLTNIDPREDEKLADKDIVFSADIKGPNITQSITSSARYYAVLFSVWCSNNFSSWTRRKYKTWYFDNSGLGANIKDFVDNEWFRLICKTKGLALNGTEWTGDNSIDEYTYCRYGIEFGSRTANPTIDEIYAKKFKLEIADEMTDWVPAPEDFGYDGDSSVLSASPQSVEDSDEVAAPEAEEIE